MIISKVWAMPNKNTFSIPPIKIFVETEIADKSVIVDPFANTCRYGTVRNDLNPDYGTEFCMDALEFLQGLSDECADVVLYDPPYSVRQASELYRSVGKELLTATVTNFKYWSKCKDNVARILRPGGICLEKPVEFLERFVLVSCPKDGVILDAFMGSGSTAIATIRNDRKFIGIEKSDEYFDIASKRIKMSENVLKGVGTLFEGIL